MRKLLILSLVLALAGCSQTSNNGSQESSAVDTTAVADNQEQTAEVRLQAIYADVFGWYAKAEKSPEVLQQMPDFDEQYMSAGYKDALHKVQAVDKQAEADGEIGFLDSDHWIQGQDFQNLKMSVIGVKPDGNDRCKADVDITNCGTTKRIAVVLVKENGQWMIDDFVVDGQSEKTQMLEYVKQ